MSKLIKESNLNLYKRYITKVVLENKFLLRSEKYILNIEEMHVKESCVQDYIVYSK